MATVVITPEMQRANAEALLGKDPGKFRDPGQRWTAKRYQEIQRLLKQTEADRPVTILNLNPFPLKINGGVYFPDEVPACLPGHPYAIHVIKQTRWGHRDLGCDAQNMMQMEPVPAIPLVLAAEYIREFVQQEGGFGGVLCYVGSQHPETFKKGAKIRVPEVAYNDLGEFYVEVHERDFHELLASVRQKRNESLLRRLQSANSWYENDSQRMNVNDSHRDIARLALHEGLDSRTSQVGAAVEQLDGEATGALPELRIAAKDGRHSVRELRTHLRRGRGLQERADRLWRGRDGPADGGGMEDRQPNQGGARQGEGARLEFVSRQ